MRPLLWKLQNISTLQPRFTALTDRGSVLVAVLSSASDELLKMSQAPAQPWPAMLNGRYGVPPSPTYLPAALHALYVDDEWGVYPAILCTGHILDMARTLWGTTTTSLMGQPSCRPWNFMSWEIVNVSLGFAIMSEKSSWREEDGQPVTQLSLKGG